MLRKLVLHPKRALLREFVFCFCTVHATKMWTTRLVSTVAGRRILCAVLCLSVITVPLALTRSGLSYAVDSCSEGAVSRLYFGQTTPDGVVAEMQWRAFVAESVTPRFPAGFTELQGQGHWRDGRGAVIEEDTRIVEIVHDGMPSARERVRAVAADYRHRFAQQSVLVTQAASLRCF
jgi:Protein of unknown function (DUF3574)